MDTLALLCTLHADGPATWRRLRENGCHKLAELARYAPEQLSLILGGTPAGARRFLREARLLGERSGTPWLEREEPAAAANLELPAVLAEASAELPLPVRDQELVEDVLRAWRDEDHKDFAAPAPPESVPAESESTFELVPSAPPVRPATSAGQQSLDPNGLDGLSDSACAELHAQGVLTLEALLEADLGQLALRSGLGYSRLYRWRSLAERRLRAAHTQSPPPLPERLSPAEVPAPAAAPELLAIPARDLELPRRTPRWSPLEEGAAGPFA